MAERLYQEGLGARKFGSLNETTQQLVLAILQKLVPVDQHIGDLANNLRVSPVIVDAAQSLYDEQCLLGTWQYYFDQITGVCLPAFHRESYDHCQRVPQIIAMIRQLIEVHGLANIPDYGIAGFGQFQGCLNIPPPQNSGSQRSPKKLVISLKSLCLDFFSLRLF